MGHEEGNMMFNDWLFGFFPETRSLAPKNCRALLWISPSTNVGEIWANRKISRTGWWWWNTHLCWFYILPGWWCNVPILKNDGVRQWVKDDISFPVAAGESLLGRALWPGTTLYRGWFSSSNLAEQCHPRQNRSLPGLQTPQAIAGFASPKRCAVQSLLLPARLPCWGHEDRPCLLRSWRLRPLLGPPVLRGLMVHGNIAPCILWSRSSAAEVANAGVG